MSRDPSQMRNAARTLDFILSTATAPLPWTAYVEALRPNGTLTIVSRLSSEAEAGVASAPASLLVAGQKSIAGSVTGGRAVTQEMLMFAARHDIAAKTEVFSFADINSAVQRVRNNAARYRVVLET
jgi:uncharacterized zinc-type alcohol dehydrogenase-like protein